MVKSYSLATKVVIKKRDNFKCFFCETTKKLTIAHIFVPKKDGGKPVEENGMIICRGCHDALDFGTGVTVEQQIKMLRLCEIYLTFTYMREIKSEDVKIMKKGRNWK